MSVSKKLWAALLLAALCLLSWGCDGKQAAEPEPQGTVYQIWPADEWRPCYLHWLAGEPDRLLVGSVGVIGGEYWQNSVEVLDLALGDLRSMNTTGDNISHNWFYDVRLVEDAATGRTYLHNKFDPEEGLYVRDGELNFDSFFATAAQNPWAYLRGEELMRAADNELMPGVCGWLLEIAPGELWRHSDLEGQRSLLAADEFLGQPFADYDISPDQSLYAQLTFDGLLTMADLTSGEARTQQLPPPEGWIGYVGLKFLPGNYLAVTVPCEEKVMVQQEGGQPEVQYESVTVIQIWQPVGEAEEMKLLAESHWNLGEDMALLDAPDADHLLLASKSRVTLFNWRIGDTEKDFFVSNTDSYADLQWGTEYMPVPEDLAALLATPGAVQYAAYEPESGRLAVIKVFPAANSGEFISQLIVLNEW